MPEAPKTPQQQMLEAVKEYVTLELSRFKQETMSAVNDLGLRLDNSLSDAPNQPDTATRQAWLREQALRAAVDLYRSNEGTVQASREEILAAAQAFEAFLAAPAQEAGVVAA